MVAIFTANAGKTEVENAAGEEFADHLADDWAVAVNVTLAGIASSCTFLCD